MFARGKTARDGMGQYSLSATSLAKLALMVVGVLALYHELSAAWSRLNLVCLTTGFFCQDNGVNAGLIHEWQSGALMLQTSERVQKMARMMGIRSAPSIEANSTELAWVSLPGNLERMALAVGDYVAHYQMAPAVIDSSNLDAAAQTQWDDFASLCWKWRYNLTQVARDAYSVQLSVRTVAIKGLAVLKLMNETWVESSANTRDQLLLELTSLRKHITTLAEKVRMTEGRILEQESAGSMLITTAIGRVQLTELEIANRAQTWSWSTTLLVYGVATVIGSASSAVMPVSAPAVVMGIAHFVNSRKNEQFKSQLRTQNMLYTQAGAVLTDARTVLLQMDKELLEFADDLSHCEESVMVAIGRVENRPDNDTSAAIQSALSRALKDLESLHDHSQRAISAYTGQNTTPQPQQSLALSDGR